MLRTIRNCCALSVVLTAFALGEDIDEAIKLFNNFKFDEARKAFQEILKKKPKDPRSPEIYFYLARLFSEPESTVAYYELIINDYPESRFGDKAYLELAKIDFARKEYNKAINRLNTLKDKYPETIVIDQALFWLGLAYVGNSDKRNGILTLQGLVEKYPESPWTTRARSVLQSEKQPTEIKGERFTVQVGSYRSYVNAQTQMGQLKKEGFSCQISKFSVGSDTFYRVWVGEFATHEEAKNYLTKLDSLGYKGNVVKK